MICWDTTKSENKFIGVISGTLFVSGDDRLFCWDTTKSEDKVFGDIFGTLFVSGDDRLIGWDTAKSEDKLIKSEDELIGVAEIDVEENWDTTESVGVFGRETKCCRLNTILPVGTAIKFPILEFLFGGLR